MTAKSQVRAVGPNETDLSRSFAHRPLNGSSRHIWPFAEHEAIWQLCTFISAIEKQSVSLR